MTPGHGGRGLPAEWPSSDGQQHGENVTRAPQAGFSGAERSGAT